MKPEEALTMEKLLNELQSVDTVKLVLTGCGESIYESREVYEAIRPFVEKQIPKKPERLNAFKSIGKCKGCEKVISTRTASVYCQYCGNKVDWGNKE